MSIPSNRKLIGMVLDEVLGGQLPAHMSIYVSGRLGTDRVGIRVTRRQETEGPNEDLLVGYYDADTEGGQAVGTMVSAMAQALCYTERGKAMPRFGEQPAWSVVYIRPEPRNPVLEAYAKRFWDEVTASVEERTTDEILSK